MMEKERPLKLGDKLQIYDTSVNKWYNVIIATEEDLEAIIKFYYNTENIRYGNAEEV
jgi:hypothetical protein